MQTPIAPNFNYMPQKQAEEQPGAIQRLLDWIGEKTSVSSIGESYALTGPEQQLNVETEWNPFTEALIALGSADMMSVGAQSGNRELMTQGADLMEKHSERANLRQDIVGPGQYMREWLSVPVSAGLMMIPGGGIGKVGYGVMRGAGTRVLSAGPVRTAAANALGRFTGVAGGGGRFPRVARGAEWVGNRLFPAAAIASSSSNEIPGVIGGGGYGEAGALAGYAGARSVGEIILASPLGKTRVGRALGGFANLGSIVGAYTGSGAASDYAAEKYAPTREDWALSSWDRYDWMKKNELGWISPERQAVIDSRRY